MAYIDCSHGISSEGLLEAMIDAGLPMHYLAREFKKISVGPLSLQGFCQSVAKSRLSPQAKKYSLDVFRFFFSACGDITFHESEAARFFVGVVGAAIGFDYFRCDQIFSSQFPATMGRNLGIALVATLAHHVGESPLQKILYVGRASKNVRFLVGEGFSVWMVEATIDDMNPQIYDHVMDLLFRAGAVDATLQPVQMKKNRPGILLSCQVPWEKRDRACDIILRETTTFGVRYYPVERKVLARELKLIHTRLGKMHVKVGIDDAGKIVKQVPEYQDVVRLARRKKIPLTEATRQLLRRL